MSPRKKGEWGPHTMIEWEDASGVASGAWNRMDDIKALKTTMIRSIGWIVKETKDEVVLVSSVSSSNLGHGEMCIPIGCVRRRWTMKQPKGSRK